MNRTGKPGASDPLAPSGACSRRDFAATAGAALAWLAGAQAAAAVPPLPVEPPPARPGRKAMVIDRDRCTGCNACAVACKAEHGVRLGGFRSWVSERETGSYPKTRREFLPRLCNHCEDPPCMKVCPTGATRKRTDGIVTIAKDICIGCRHCMAACPYGARYFNPQEDPEELQEIQPARTRGTVDKCDFCAHRVDAGGEPACVATCPAGARTFGNALDPSSEVSKLWKSQRSSTLLPEMGTNPSVSYLGGSLDPFRQA